MMNEKSGHSSWGDVRDERDEPTVHGDGDDPWAAVTDRVGEDDRPGDRARGGGRETGGGDMLGSLAEEAMKLFDALQERAAREVGKVVIKNTAGGIGQVLGGGGRRRDVWEEAVAAPEDDEYVCRACPVCRVIAAQRESGASVADHLAAAGGELLTAIRQAVDTLTRPSAPRRPREDDPDVRHVDPG